MQKSVGGICFHLFWRRSYGKKRLVRLPSPSLLCSWSTGIRRICLLRILVAGLVYSFAFRYWCNTSLYLSLLYLCLMDLCILIWSVFVFVYLPPPAALSGFLLLNFCLHFLIFAMDPTKLHSSTPTSSKYDKVF